MRYKNKVDVWIAIVLWGVVLMFVPMIFFIPEEEAYIMYLTMVGTALMTLPFLYGYVELGDEQITVRVGWFRQRIKYEDIKSIRKCKNFLSSMALTSTRIEIRLHNKSYLRGTTFIGPVNRDDFFEELKVRCYNLEDDAS